MRSEIEDELLEIERKNDDPLRIILRTLSRLSNLSFALMKKINQIVNPVLPLGDFAIVLLHPILLLAAVLGDIILAIMTIILTWGVLFWTHVLHSPFEKTKNP